VKGDILRVVQRFAHAFVLGLALACSPAPQASAIPTGTGWWCPEPEPNMALDDTGGWCARSQELCKAELTRELPCVQRDAAHCFTFVAYSGGQPDSICLATYEQCHATRVHGRDYGTSVSTCVETP
jgi:hypothetical protein